MSETDGQDEEALLAQQGVINQHMELARSGTPEEAMEAQAFFIRHKLVLSRSVPMKVPHIKFDTQHMLEYREVHFDPREHAPKVFQKAFLDYEAIDGDYLLGENPRTLQPHEYILPLTQGSGPYEDNWLHSRYWFKEKDIRLIITDKEGIHYFHNTEEHSRSFSIALRAFLSKLGHGDITSFEVVAHKNP